MQVGSNVKREPFAEQNGCFFLSIKLFGSFQVAEGEGKDFRDGRFGGGRLALQ